MVKATENIKHLKYLEARKRRWKKVVRKDGQVILIELKKDSDGKSNGKH